MGLFSKEPKKQDQVTTEQEDVNREALFALASHLEAAVRGEASDADVASWAGIDPSVLLPEKEPLEQPKDIRAKAIDRLVLSFCKILKGDSQENLHRLSVNDAEGLAGRLFKATPALLENGNNESNVFKMASLLVQQFGAAFDGDTAISVLERRIAFLRANAQRTPPYQELFAFAPWFTRMGAEGVALQEAFADLVIDRANLCKTRWEGLEQPSEKFINVIVATFPQSRFDALLEAFSSSTRGFATADRSFEIGGALARDFIELRDRFSKGSLLKAIFSYQKRLSASLLDEKSSSELQKLKEWPQTLRDVFEDVLLRDEAATEDEKKGWRTQFDAEQDELVGRFVPALLKNEFHHAAASILLREVIAVGDEGQELVNQVWRTEEGMAQVCAGERGEISILEKKAKTYVLPPEQIVAFVADGNPEDLKRGVSETIRKNFFEKTRFLPSFPDAYKNCMRPLRERKAALPLTAEA